jgi:hypothetical protein
MWEYANGFSGPKLGELATPNLTHSATIRQTFRKGDVKFGQIALFHPRHKSKINFRQEKEIIYSENHEIKL